MACSIPVTTSLALGIVLPILLIVLASILIHRYRSRANDTQWSWKSDPEVPTPEHLPNSVASSHSTLESSHNPDTLLRGTVRRQTRNPQTLLGWVQTSNEDHGRKVVIRRGERWPSLEHGPGPVITESASIRNAPLANAEGVDESAEVVKSERQGSVDESSLREAVLRIGEDGEGNAKDEVQWNGVEEAKAEPATKETGKVKKGRGYSGAWP